MSESRKSDVIAVLACVGALLAINVVLFAVGRLPLRQGGLPDWPKTCAVLVGVVLTLAVFSFLYKDNPFFRAAENLFVGLGLGVSLTVQWYDFAKPLVYDILVAPLFDPTVDVQRVELLRLIPLALGVMIVLRISKKYGWVSRYPLAMLVGFWAGFSIQPTIHSDILRHVTATIVPTPMSLVAWLCVAAAAVLFCFTAFFAPKGGRLAFWLKLSSGLVILGYILMRCVPFDPDQYEAWTQASESIDRIVILLGTFSVLFYFFFSLEHKGTVGAISRVGIIFLMVSFGASFGYTVMARESLLIGRFQFLLADWLGVL